MYIKANLNYNFNYQIIQIIKLLKQFLGNKFIEQEDERSGLGCHPYHITMIGNIEKHFNDTTLINNYLSEWTRDSDDIIVTIKPIIKITNRGTVLLLIEAPYLVQVAEEMLNKLSPNVSSYTSNLHITLGRVFDINLFNQTIDIDDSYFSSINKNYYIDSFGWDF